MTTAICYIGSSGHLFPAAVSAAQARQHAPAGADVVVVALGDGGPVPEDAALRRFCADHGVTVLAGDLGRLGGLHPMYGRLFLDQFLPPEVDRILYLDGDTQVLGPLGPLLEAPIRSDEVAGARDPMVVLRLIDESFRRRIDTWWDASGIPPAVRADYLNSGMLLLAREHLPALRAAALDAQQRSPGTLVFPDQDAINLALEGRARPVSMRWNFPGFLLGSALAESVEPRIVHFMSEPRPWDGPFWPWGAHFHEPYRRAALSHPELARHVRRIGARGRARYRAQQLYKRLRERPVWQSVPARDALAELEAHGRVLA